jgi:GNAT superfamily N-acetyltransferase
MEIVIARAGMEAVPETDALISEAADWLIAKGEPLWGPNETSYDELVRVTRAGELVTGRRAGALAACMYLHDQDTLFWPKALPGEAFYLHRLAVARKYAGRGYARAMLDWAARETRSKNRPYLRLDCEPRQKLLALYRSTGFARIDDKPIQVGEHVVVRHEKRILTTTRT